MTVNAANILFEILTRSIREISFFEFLPEQQLYAKMPRIARVLIPVIAIVL